ncbi:MAG TPA: dephospho-CoA kinase, partial [Mycobacterium sp.]|nr:dephospho-CoA kinase [Mycobacterium sp.]
ARDLWYQRIVPFAHNVATRTPVADPTAVVAADPGWADQATRIIARLKTACGHRAVRIDHTGSTAVAGLDARDIIDVQITVAALDVADELADNLLQAGYPRVDSITADTALAGRDELWHKRFHASADPGRPTHIHIRVDGSPNQRFALMFTDWLNANPAARSEYQEFKRRRSGSPGDWFAAAYPRAQSWAQGAGWTT